MRTVREWLLRGAWISWLEVLLVAVLAVALARATWLFAAPRATGEPATEIQSVHSSAPSERALRLFGAAAAGSAAATPDARIRLVGVIAPGQSRSGVALFSVNGGKARAFAVGESIVDGVVLREVHAEHAMLAKGGSPERIALERKPVTNAPR